MIQKTNLSFLKCFLSFSFHNNWQREGKKKDGEVGAERETKLQEGHKAEGLNLHALAVPFP